jgi:hypothetical protein
LGENALWSHAHFLSRVLLGALLLGLLTDLLGKVLEINLIYLIIDVNISDISDHFMETKLDITLKFPSDQWSDQQFEKLRKYCECVENVEDYFNIEFSCGDGKYFSDFWKWTEGGALIANWPDTPEGDDEVFKYDGKVCLETPPRNKTTKISLALNKHHRFTIKYTPKCGEQVFYLNNKETGRKWVG